MTRAVTILVDDFWMYYSPIWDVCDTKTYKKGPVFTGTRQHTSGRFHSEYLSESFIYLDMGNSHSHSARSRSQTLVLDSKPHPQVVVRKRKSTVLSALTLGCTSASTYPDYCPSQDSTLGDRDRDEKLSFEHPPPLYGSTSDLIEDDANVAFKGFIKEYPEYHLTWILDALRRSDFARLDRTGETYVDYMGGSLYPESLIRVHTAFLQRHVLGNTHSVNNS